MVVSMKIYDVQNFKKFDLDAIYIATNAPERSTFNRVVRQVAPVSCELTDKYCI